MRGAKRSILVDVELTFLHWIFDVFFFCSSLAHLENFPYKFIVKEKFVEDYLRHFEVMAFKKKTRAEEGPKEGPKESQKTKGKVYDLYARKALCEDPTKLKKLRVPRLNK